MTERTIVAFGDSLSEGYGVSEDEAYPALLEKRLREEGYRFRVLNAGISGETSSGALERIGEILALKPDMVILETGANDAFVGMAPSLTRKNIESLLRIFQEAGITVLLAGMRIVFQLGRAYVEAFEAIYPDISEQFQVVLMPFFLEDVLEDPFLNFGDGIHPNAAGYQVITGNLYPFVLEAINRIQG